MVKKILNGISAGVMILIGCAVFLACAKAKYNGANVIGAIFFAVALLTICIKGYSLFTGKVGFLVESHTKEDVSVLLLGLLGNAIGVVVCGIAVRFALPDLQVYAEEVCLARLNQDWWQTLIRAIFCGVLMYVAVSIYKEHKNVVGILFAIPVFILSGFEHSIADIGYFAISGIVSWEAFGFLWIVILGNAIGAWILPLLSLKFKKEKQIETDIKNDTKS